MKQQLHSRPLKYPLPIVLLLFLFLLSGIEIAAAQTTGNAADNESGPGARASGFPSIDAILWQDAIERIMASEERGINRFFTSEDTAQLTPASPISSTLIDKANAIDYAVGIESLYFIPRENLAPRLLELPREEFLLSLYNTLRSVSSLEGIEYYSASRERMRTLFAETWVIEGPEDHSRLPDPTVERIPRKDTIYIHQKDLTFGNNVSRVVYRHERDALSMSISNETTMRYMIFPLVKEGNMSMQMLILPVEEGIIFYGLSSIDVLDLKVFYKKMRSSFTNRLIALKDWFLAEVGR